MATQLKPQPIVAERPSTSVRVLDDASTVDVRAFARQFVSVMLAIEGVTTTPAKIAEAS